MTGLCLDATMAKMAKAVMSDWSISVVIPSFNRTALTAQAVRSVMDQDWPVDEIIVVDDASDPPLDIKDLPNDPSGIIHVLRLDQNKGAAGARQAGVDAAQGTLVAFLDSDDVWLPGKLRAQMSELAQLSSRTSGPDGLWAVSCGWHSSSDYSKRYGTWLPKSSREATDFAAGCWYSPGTTIILPRSAFEAVGPFDPSIRRLEDYDWFMRFGLAGGRLHVTPKIGARIMVGRRASLEAVREARRAVLARHDATLPDGMRRDMKAYLALEMAKAAHNEKKAFTLAFWLLVSIWHHPRLRIPLRRWWAERS